MISTRFSAGTIERIGNVIKVVFDVNRTISKNDLMEITNIRKELFGDNVYVSLIDLRLDFLHISPEAKDYSTNSEIINKFRVAEALLVKNTAQKIGVQVYVKMFRKFKNTRIFTSEKDAMSWLEKEYQKFAN